MRTQFAIGVVLVALAHSVIVAQQPPINFPPPPSQRPQVLTFRSTVDLVAVDVQIVDNAGQPVPGLKTDDFQVWINGHPRRVASADLVKYPIVTSTIPTAVSLLPSVTPVTPQDVTGRVMILAVDEASIGLGQARAAMNAAKAFVNRLPPEDVVGVYAVPFGVPTIDLMHDHEAVGRALDKITGRFFPPPGEYALSMSEIIDITANDTRAFEAVAVRECPVYLSELTLQACRQKLQGEAFSKAGYYETVFMQSLADFRLLLRGLQTLPGRKVVVLVSGGMTSPDRMGGRPDMTEMMKSAVTEAAASGSSVYALHIDTSLAEAYSAAVKPTLDASARLMSIGRDRMVQSLGLERVAGESGGAVFRDETGAGEFAFDRIYRETSAYYLLGVESLEGDRDGHTHFIRVQSKVKNATIRARSQVVIPRSSK